MAIGLVSCIDVVRLLLLLRLLVFSVFVVVVVVVVIVVAVVLVAVAAAAVAAAAVVFIIVIVVVVDVDKRVVRKEDSKSITLMGHDKNRNPEESNHEKGGGWHDSCSSYPRPHWLYR